MNDDVEIGTTSHVCPPYNTYPTHARIYVEEYVLCIADRRTYRVANFPRILCVPRYIDVNFLHTHAHALKCIPSTRFFFMSRDVERRVCLCERHFVRLGRRSVWKYIFANLIVMFRTCVSVFLYIFVVCNNMYVVYIEICMRMAAMHFIVVSSRSIRFRFIHFFCWFLFKSIGYN